MTIVQHACMEKTCIKAAFIMYPTGGGGGGGGRGF